MFCSCTVEMLCCSLHSLDKLNVVKAVNAAAEVERLVYNAPTPPPIVPLIEDSFSDSALAVALTDFDPFDLY